MTATSEQIDVLLSYAWNDWKVTSTEMRRVLALLRADPNIDATITDLQSRAAGMHRMLERVTDPALLRELVAVLATRASSTTSLVRKAIQRARYFNSGFQNLVQWSGFPGTDFFDLCAALNAAGQIHRFMTRTGTATRPAPSSSNPASPFSGVGATGTNPASLSVSLIDKALLITGHDATRARYSNPIPGDLGSYIKSLSPNERIAQAQILIRQPISTLFPHAYSGPLPLRSQVISCAGRLHDLEPQLVAAFILAEQRDQSLNEDAADVSAALSVKQHNSSIGLGQIVVTTAQKNDLFADLLPKAFRDKLNREQIIRLLASDEFNIFATARYIRLVANRASGMRISDLPQTQRVFPSINLATYRQHSHQWSLDNIKALASEYTSTAWDDHITTGWAWFVEQGYITIKNSSLSFP